MTNSIPLLGWVLIVFLVLLVISLNIGLFTSMKKKNQKKPWISNLEQTRKTIQDPFWAENQKMGELANNLKKLNRTSETGKDNETPFSSEETKRED